ncbi:hypothetical protein OAD74_07085 [Alphaproteobacteria bacterium]|nr:hypothetical protein [Alphaproteobacteria bacterium]
MSVNLFTEAYDYNQEMTTSALLLDSMKNEKLHDYNIINGNWVHRTAIVEWSKITIGEKNIIGPYACLGLDAENKFEHSNGRITIGNANIFREFVTVHLPTKCAKGTTIGNDNYFMAKAHVAHDCAVEDNVTMCNNSAIGGHTHLMQGSVLALNSSVHQFQVIGSWSMIGMNSCVTKSASIKPGFTYCGVPARKLRKNRLALKRSTVNDATLTSETDRFLELRKNIGGFCE